MDDGQDGKQRQIDATDWQIGSRVYDLFGRTEFEICIVEEAMLTIGDAPVRKQALCMGVEKTTLPCDRGSGITFPYGRVSIWGRIP